MSYETEITLDVDFWDCECDSDFIHSRFLEFCVRCGATRSEQPLSRANEVSYFIAIGRPPQSGRPLSNDSLMREINYEQSA